MANFHRLLEPKLQYPGLFQANLVQRPVVLIGQHIQIPIRTLPHIPNPRLEFTQQAFFVNDFIAIELQTDQLLAHQRTDEHVVLPRFETIAIVERHPAQARGLFPDMARPHGAFGGLAIGFRDRLA